MAGSPEYKVYRGKEYIAACKYAEDAAALVALNPSEGEVRHGHRDVVWREGKEAFSAGESYNNAAQIMHERIGLRRRQAAMTAARAAIRRATQGSPQ